MGSLQHFFGVQSRAVSAALTLVATTMLSTAAYTAEKPKNWK